MSAMALDQVKRVARLLSRAERARLAMWLLGTADTRSPVSVAPRSLYGLLAAHGPGPDETASDDARRAAWRACPREGSA
jgi:hypothetical protein